jgi:acyl-CoA synthetase (AMP-forming)/AMP-acid ligase II
MGLMNNLMLCLTLGVPLVMMSPFDFVKRPALWLQGLSDTGATITWSPNFGYALAAERVADRELEGVDLSAVRGFWNAAERIHSGTIRAFGERFSRWGVEALALKSNFGCAENVGGATFTSPADEISVEHIDPVALHELQLARVVDDDDERGVSVVSCGRPHAGISIHILDNEGRRLPDGHIGNLALDTVSAMDGYLGDPEATAQALKGSLLNTGDVGYVRGGEFYWTGRAGDRITVRGRKIDPSEFEAPLATVTGLRTGSFVAFGIDNADDGTQRVVVIAEIRENEVDRETTVASIRRAIFDRLGLRVDDVVLVTKGTLTKTSSGKRRNSHFKDLYLKGGLLPADLT